jgi:hypothetical protein
MNIKSIPKHCPYCGSKVILEGDTLGWWNGREHFRCETLCNALHCFSGIQKDFMTVNWTIGKGVQGICFDFDGKETVLMYYTCDNVPYIHIPFVDDTLDFSDITIGYMNRLLKLKAFI